MPESLINKAKGIHSNNNIFSAAPAGSMSEAVNVVIDKSEVVEPRRGFFQYGTLAGLAKQLLNYKDRILAHVGTTLVYDSDEAGDFNAISGLSVSEVDAIIKLRSIEANGNLYFTSSTGIKKISARTAADLATVSIENAGAVKATNLIASTLYTQVGFLSPNSKVSYRLVYGKNDLNENLLLGAPSPIATTYNSNADDSCIVSLSFDLPALVAAGDFYQIYRTGLSSGATTPLPLVEPADAGDEMYLVLEDTITAANITAGTITVSDLTPDDFRKNGALLYTNPVSGEGITQSNDVPPFAKDICSYKGFTFLANTQTIQRLNLNVVAVDGIVEFSTASPTTFTVIDGVGTPISYTFSGKKETYTIDYTGMAAGDFLAPAANTAYYFKLHSASDERKYYVWFYDAVAAQIEPVISGYIGIKVIVAAADTPNTKMTAARTAIMDNCDDFNITHTLATESFVVVCANNGDVATITTTETFPSASFTWAQDNVGVGEDLTNNRIFLPRVPATGENGPSVSQQLEQMGKSMARLLARKDAIVNAYYISAFDDIPGQLLLEQKSTTGAAFYLNSNAVSDTFNPIVPATGSTIISSNEVRPNRIYYSKYQQPDAFPLVNYLDVGPKDREIKRIIPLRDSLFILKENGIYKLTGDTAVAGTNNFNIVEFDFSMQVLAPNTATVLNNQIYALSTQGVIVISDTVVSVVSRPIENQISKLLKSGSSYKSVSFGVPYETDRSYLLFTVDDKPDTVVANQVFRYNTFTDTWTRWDISKACGIVNFADDKLYLGATDLSLIEKERKSLSRLDHTDREYLISISADGVNTTTNEIKLNSLTNAAIGDVLLQRQYLTTADFNRMLTKLDMDIGVTDTNYSSTLITSYGNNLRLSLQDLATKLDADTGVTSTNYAASIADTTHTITANSIASQTVITIGAHAIQANRYVTITGSNSTPSINGTHQITAVSATTITIAIAVTVAGTTGTVRTDINNFKDYQVCFNLIAAKLNLDTSVFYTNYQLSSGYVDFESPILARNLVINAVKVAQVQTMIFGAAYIFKAIESYIVYNPQFFGDPSVEKQVSEGTLMFEDSNFSKATVAYATDKHPSFVEITFDKSGNGDFGQFGFGEVNFGGIAAPVPLRTYIPMSKQRCRFMNIKFLHNVALEKYALYGASLKFRPYNTRSFK